MRAHQTTLSAIEREFGVPGTVILAIWGRETDYGRYALPYDGLRVLATQAYVGRRKDQYRAEFIAALKLIENGDVTRKNLRSSWAGATGLTQFLPSEFSKHGVDFDGDGHRQHLDVGAGCARLGSAAARQQRMAQRCALGL
jgi:membrane-bound lytic murein transglycosylase B